MKRLVLVIVVGCGGGPSLNSVDPSTRIISSNCQLLGTDTQITVDVAFDTSLDIGQAWESDILVGGDQMTSESEFFSCGSWTPTGTGQSARGCQRDREDQPEQQNINHMYNAGFQNPLQTPVNVMIIANTFDAPGSFSIGAGAFDNINCF